jgi:molybdenum cofactor cytidylyltransferase
MANMNFGAVILAAGFSSRMGEFKPLLHIGPRSMIGHAVKLFQDSSIDDILIVLGHQAEKSIPEVEQYGCRYVINDYYDQGMFSSMQTGIRGLQPDCDAFFMLPVDIPLVKKETVEQLISVIHKDSMRSVYYPLYHGKRGHPPLIQGKLITPILTYTGEKGMRGLLANYDNESVGVTVNDPFIVNDADREDDFLRLQRMYRDELKLRP